jgi:lycopene beta-cyclase
MTGPSYVIVGGGLAGGLTALALANEGLGSSVTLVESGGTLGGDAGHTWSCHESDLDEDARELVMPLVAHRWPRQLVRFPGRERRLDTGYLTVTGERYARVVRERLERAGARVLFGARAVELDEGHVHLEDGGLVWADAVLDARGPVADTRPSGGRGFQKFVGLEVELEEDGPWQIPIVMDAAVEQDEGFRFVYVLPFSKRRVLIEDTVYADDGLVDPEAFSRRVVAYVEAHGGRIRRILRREIGALPLPLHDEPATSDGRRGPLAIGYRGGFFHGVTGYSLPEAARVARAIARSRTPSEAALALAALSQARAAQRRFQRLLARLLFRALPAPRRWTALDRFYRLPEEVIARFYASRSTALDRVRLLVGRPPAGFSWRKMLSATREAA